MAREKLKIRLQGHEKFALREGWLNKGITLISERPDVFLGKEGTDVFGIGNNMVKSLRYWLKAFQLIEEQSGTGAKLTDIGRIIRDNDKYIEQNFTIWVLHSNITRNIAEATTWYMFFNRCAIDEFEKEELINYLGREIFKYTGNDNFSEQSLKNDIDVLLNMYSKNKGIIDPEDKNTSPMAQLGLVKKMDNVYIKSQPDRRMISKWNILYELACLLKNKEFISIDDASAGEKSISAIYQIPRVTINEMLDRLDNLGYIRVDRTAGLDMIYKINDLLPEQVAEEYYKEHR